MLGRFRRSEITRTIAAKLFEAISGQARRPLFHTRFGVGDTIDGRFDLLTLHLFVAMEALKRQGEAGTRLSEALVAIAFTMFDEALRELGVGDMGLARRIKAMADAFYGRLQAYERAANEVDMAAALIRNLYRADEARAAEARLLAHYIQGERQMLADSAAQSRLLAGSIDFRPLPEL